MHGQDSCYLLGVGRGGDLEHAAGTDVGFGDGRQVLGRELAVLVGKQPARLAQPRAIERIAHAARVGEMRLLDPIADVFLERLARAGAEAVVLLLEHPVGDRSRSTLRVVRKIQVVRDARTHAGVGAEEGLHAVLVAGQDHDQVVALVLHHLQQDLDRLLSVVALVLRAVQVIGLVDEQHAAHRLLQHFLGLRSGVADVLADQVVARHRHQVAFAHVAEPMQDLRHAQRDRGLAGARIAGEGHVQARRLRLQPEVHAQLVDHQQRRDVADAALDRREPDQIALELVHDRAGLALRQHLVHGAQCARHRAAARRLAALAGGGRRRRLRRAREWCTAVSPSSGHPAGRARTARSSARIASITAW